jgi:fatty aldehyde-generating acyl-ACP reductase
MHKFAFLVHLRSYREDLKEMWRPFGWIPEPVFRFLLRNRPVDPFVWSEVRLTPGADEPEGYIIMIPYSGKQILEQQRQMLPLIRKALKLATEKGAKRAGLGALTSPVTLGGKLLANRPDIAITNGNAYTAVVLCEKIMQLLAAAPTCRPKVALVGAAGSVGSLVSLLLVRHNACADLLLIGRNKRKLASLAVEIKRENDQANPEVSDNISSVDQADIVVLMTSSADQVLNIADLKYGAVIIDATQPRNVSEAAVAGRPDITLVDGGLVSVNDLKTNKIGQLGLPEGISFACLAETMILAKAGYQQDFSIGNPTLQQAEIISKLAGDLRELGFGLAPDHSFGKPLVQPAANQVESPERLHY